MSSFIRVYPQLLITVAFGGILTGCSKASTSAEATGRPAPAKAVQTDTVRREEVKRTVNVSGTLAAENEVTVSSQAEGVVSRILADLGDRVLRVHGERLPEVRRRGPGVACPLRDDPAVQEHLGPEHRKLRGDAGEGAGEVLAGLACPARVGQRPAEIEDGDVALGLHQRGVPPERHRVAPHRDLPHRPGGGAFERQIWP